MSETPEMVERVARAIYHRMGNLMGPDEAPDDWADIGPDHDRARDAWFKVAAAAIEAMRVPTDAMLDEGPPPPYMDALVWQSMLDAALTAAKREHE